MTTKEIQKSNKIIQERHNDWFRRRKGDDRECSYKPPIIKSDLLSKITKNQYKCPCCGSNLIVTKRVEEVCPEEGMIHTTTEYVCEKCGYISP